MLVYAAETTSDLGESIRIWEPPIAAHVQTFDEDQIRYIADYLEGRGWLKMTQQGPVLYAITGEGLIKAEEWQMAEAKSGQGFVAMWFDTTLTEAWLNGFSKAIEDAGYKALRIDNKEHTNKICDEVLVEIRRSRFVVADFTGQRNGVYYEAGFAAGLPGWSSSGLVGKTILPICTLTYVNTIALTGKNLKIFAIVFATELLR